MPQPLPIAATIALEMIGPMPGTVITLRQLSSLFASVQISSVTVSIRSSSRRRTGKISDDACHAWRKNVGPLGQDVRQLLAKKAESLPDHYAAFQKKATNLIDHRGSLADEARPHPMQRLQIQLLVGLAGTKRVVGRCTASATA